MKRRLEVPRAPILPLLAVLLTTAVASAEGPGRPSSSLLCALARGAAPPGRALVGAPEGCGCDEPSPGCRVVDLANDRRLAVAIAPGAAVGVEIAPRPGDRVRLAIGVASSTPARIGVSARLLDAGGVVLREWQHEIVRWGGWVDLELDTAGIDAAGVRRLEIEVAPGPVAPPDTEVAVALPRLVPAAVHPRPVEARAADVGPSGTVAGPGALPRNLVLYVIDTLRADHTSTYGYERPTTPHLDRLAREGTTFERAYSVGSWTRPAIATLFTGLRPASHRVGVDRGLGPWPLTIAERFRGAGWSTRAFVTNVQLVPHSLGFDRGFERFLAFPGGDGAMLATTAEVNPHLLRELETSRDEKLFLYVHTIDPHAPYDPPACYEGLFGDASYDGSIGARDTFAAALRARTMSSADVAHVRDLYDEEIRFQDEMLGTLLDRLAAAGLDRDTVVVVTSDHGEELGDHGDWEHGQRAWEELLRVPLVVRWPGRPDLAGRRVTEPVQIVDLLPTLLSSFGLPPAPEARGRNLLPVVAGSSGRPGDSPQRAAAPAGSPGRPSEPVPVLTTELCDGWDLLSIQRDGWKLVRRRPREGAPEDHLFHLASDPGERRDRVKSNHGRAEDLAGQLERLVREDEALGPSASSATAADIPDETRKRLEELGYVQP